MKIIISDSCKYDVDSFSERINIGIGDTDLIYVNVYLKDVDDIKMVSADLSKNFTGSFSVITNTKEYSFNDYKIEGIELFANPNDTSVNVTFISK